jgi:phosphoribosylanthranilate isomerase
MQGRDVRHGRTLPVPRLEAVLVRAKVCGIRSDLDLEIAVRAGADAIGLICGTTHLSEDALTPDHARLLAKRTPPPVSTVLVTHLEDAGEILDLAAHVGVDTIQIHGLVTHETVLEVFERAGGRRIVKAVHVLGPAAVDETLQLADACDAILLDSRTTERLGGTGRTHDWSISRQVVDALRDRRRPVILAGGLRPDNVGDAVRAVRPFAVDVNSGVEDAHGDKALERCAAFVSSARDALAQSA